MRFIFVLSAAALGLARCSSDDTTTTCDASCDVAISALEVFASLAEIYVHPTDAPSVGITVIRGPGGDGDVAVTISSDANVGVVSDPLLIPAANTQGSLVLHIGPTFTQGDATITINAANGTAVAETSLVIHLAGGSGTLDSTFGSGGILDLTPATGSDVASAMISLQSGLVIGGTHIETNDAGSTSTMEVMQITSGGSVDGTFATTTAPGELASLARVANGNLFAVGDVRSAKADIAAYRVLATGGLDPKYAVDTSLSSGDDVARAGAVQPNGDLVVAGSTGNTAAIALARYTQIAPPPPSDAGAEAEASSPNTAQLDPTFADGGFALTTLGTNSGATSLLVAGDGSLYTLGFSTTSSTDIIALHYGPSGVADPTFGGVDGGAVAIPLAVGTAGASAAVLESSGAILIASDDSAQALVVRLLSSGAIDTAFGTNGRATIAAGSPSAARAITIALGTGKILVAGFVGAPQSCFVTRLSPTGAIDTTFANAGTLVISQGDACAVAAVAVDDSGKILVLETVTSGSATHMVVARYWP